MTETVGDFKIGDTFQLTCTYKEGGTATSVSGMTIEAELRTPTGGLIETMTVTPDADQVTNPGLFLVDPTTADTSTWPIGLNEIDIQITDGGVIRSSETFTVNCVQDVTGRV